MFPKKLMQDGTPAKTKGEAQTLPCSCIAIRVSAGTASVSSSACRKSIVWSFTLVPWLKISMEISQLHVYIYIYINITSVKKTNPGPDHREIPRSYFHHLQFPIQIPSLLVLRLFGHLAGIHRIAAQSRLLMAVRHAPVPLLQAHLVSDQQKKWCNVEKNTTGICKWLKLEPYKTLFLYSFWIFIDMIV